MLIECHRDFLFTQYRHEQKKKVQNLECRRGLEVDKSMWVPSVLLTANQGMFLRDFKETWANYTTYCKITALCQIGHEKMNLVGISSSGQNSVKIVVSDSRKGSIFKISHFKKGFVVQFDPNALAWVWMCKKKKSRSLCSTLFPDFPDTSWL